ncbi:hypothetical protein C8T65DRAFT_640722 [Cerioporus squamosus]|nr:hypothetical protein C8T65DRAFT_640722 [Cerioporus squamosus]
MNTPSAARSDLRPFGPAIGFANFTFWCQPPGKKPRLPPELSDRVIEHLHDDPASLSACSLVCSSWLPAARWHYFREVTVICSNVSAFYELIHYPSSNIRNFVVSLTAECFWMEFDGGRKCPEGPCFLRDPTILSPVLASGRLPALRELRLRGIPVHVIPHPLPTVTYLDINHPPPPDWGISRWLPLLPNLHTLLAYFSRRGTAEAMRVWISQLSPWTRVVVEELLPTKVLRNLRAFSFVCTRNRSSLVKGLDQRLGSSLRVLELMCDDVFVSGGCTLSHCTSLHHIRIIGIQLIGSPETFRRFRIEHRWRMTNVAAFLAGVRAPNVSSVHFVDLPSDISTEDKSESWPGPSLAALSGNPALSRTLREVAFELYGLAFCERDDESEAERRRRIRNEDCDRAVKVIRDAWSQHWRADLACKVWWSDPSTLAAVWELDRTGPPSDAELMAESCGASPLRWSAEYAQAPYEAV